MPDQNKQLTQGVLEEMFAKGRPPQRPVPRSPTELLRCY